MKTPIRLLSAITGTALFYTGLYTNSLVCAVPLLILAWCFIIGGAVTALGNIFLLITRETD